MLNIIIAYTIPSPISLPVFVKLMPKMEWMLFQGQSIPERLKLRHYCPHFEHSILMDFCVCVDSFTCNELHVINFFLIFFFLRFISLILSFGYFTAKYGHLPLIYFSYFWLRNKINSQSRQQNFSFFLVKNLDSQVRLIMLKFQLCIPH